MIKIDENTLINELLLTAKSFSSCRKDFIKNEYNSFLALNATLACNNKKIIRCDKLKEKDIAYTIDKYWYNSYCKFIERVYKEQGLLKDISSHYCRFIKKIRFKDIYLRGQIRGYSEQDFKDVIMSYFTTCGDKYYKIAKKYFDENRINLGSNLIEKASGYFVRILWLKSAYIYILYPTYNSLSAAAIVHELGHAIDAETFIFPQQKKMPLLSDILLEVPSTTFEMGFYDYLITQKIDSEGGLILKNTRILDMFDFFKELKGVLNCQNLDFDESGNAFDENDNTYTLKTDLIYGLGYYFALHLNEIKEHSSSEFQKIFYNIISSRNESTLTDSILMTGFSMDDFITGKYIKQNIKEDCLTLKKRYKIY